MNVFLLTKNKGKKESCDDKSKILLFCEKNI